MFHSGKRAQAPLLRAPPKARRRLRAGEQGQSARCAPKSRPVLTAFRATGARSYVVSQNPSTRNNTLQFAFSAPRTGAPASNYTSRRAIRSKVGPARFFRPAPVQAATGRAKFRRGRAPSIALARGERFRRPRSPDSIMTAGSAGDMTKPRKGMVAAARTRAELPAQAPVPPDAAQSGALPQVFLNASPVCWKRI